MLRTSNLRPRVRRNFVISSARGRTLIDVRPRRAFLRSFRPLSSDTKVCSSFVNVVAPFAGSVTTTTTRRESATRTVKLRGMLINRLQFLLGESGSHRRGHRDVLLNWETAISARGLILRNWATNRRLLLRYYALS